MFIDFLISQFQKHLEADAIIWNDTHYTYGWLLDQLRHWRNTIEKEHISAGSVVVLEADFSPNSIAIFLAMLDLGLILVPISPSAILPKEELYDICQSEIQLSLDNKDCAQITRLDRKATHELYTLLRTVNHPGLVLFSSGSTGKSKAVVHDFMPLLEKYRIPRKTYRAISFLLFDHIGGINTMLYMLSSGGCLIIVPDRTPDGVLSSISRHKADLLPCSPTFINLLLMSRAYERHDISCLKLVTYGTEPMHESTLRLFHELFPTVKLVQTYGLSEVGILASKSRSTDSLWVKLGGEGIETRIQDDLLQIRAPSAMLGYLNAPTPFTKEGWFNTADRVEVDGEYIRILGRNSEVINVGGQKVHPAQVESVLLEIENVADAVVYGQNNAITGQIVCAAVKLHQIESLKDLSVRIKKWCRQKLLAHEIPVRIEIDSAFRHGPRCKRMRQTSVPAAMSNTPPQYDGGSSGQKHSNEQ